MTQALLNIDGHVNDVAEWRADAATARVARPARPRPASATGSVSYLDSYRSARSAPRSTDRATERQIATGADRAAGIILDETPLIRLIRTVVIALLIATACLLLVWIANLRATPTPAGPAPLPVASVQVADSAAAVGG